MRKSCPRTDTPTLRRDLFGRFSALKIAELISSSEWLRPVAWITWSTRTAGSLIRLIRSAEKRVAGLSTAEGQIVVVFTDDHENASRAWACEALFALVEEKKEGWTFGFRVANHRHLEWRQQDHLAAGTHPYPGLCTGRAPCSRGRLQPLPGDGRCVGRWHGRSGRGH